MLANLVKMANVVILVKLGTAVAEMLWADIFARIEGP